MEPSKAKRLVADGYDRITRHYLDLVASNPPTVRIKYLAVLARTLPVGARVLELGCGAGVPATQVLTARFRVAALDLSPNQLALARTNAPEASLVRGDMVRLPFAASSFDGAAACYAMTHVPRAEHPALLSELRRVLRPRSPLVITTGSVDSPDSCDPDWLGAPMFFSHFDGPTNTRLVEQAGFHVVSSDDERELEYGAPVTFRWIVARAPG